MNKLLFFACAAALAASVASAGTADDVLRTVNDRLAREFISHDGLLFDYVGEIPTPEEIADLKPNAMGWWCPIENGSMFTGEWLPALMSEGGARKPLVEKCVKGLINWSLPIFDLSPASTPSSPPNLTPIGVAPATAPPV